MATQTRALWAEAATPVIKKWMNDTYKQYDAKYPKVATVESSEGAYEEYMNNAGIPSMTAVGEGEQIPFADPTKGYLTRITNSKFSGKIAVTNEEYNDNRYKLWAKRASMFSNGLARKQDHKFFSLFRNGFTAAFTPYGDGKPLFSTLHPTQRLGGSTQSNASATGIPLNEANLFTGLNALYAQVDDSGELVDLTGEKIVLVVPPALQKTAFEIVKSDLRSGVANNDTNYFFHGVGMDIFVCPWIQSTVAASESSGVAGSDTAWYLVAPGASELIMQTRTGMDMADWVDNDTQVLNVSGTIRFGVGAGNWRATWGSAGAGAAYAL